MRLIGCVSSASFPSLSECLPDVEVSCHGGAKIRFGADSRAAEATLAVREQARVRSRSPDHVSKMGRRQVDLIIFDFDGVLVDTAEDIANAANFTLQYYGLPRVSVEVVCSHIGGGAEALMRELLREGHEDLLGEAAALFTTKYSECYDVRTSLYAGVREVLEHFLAAGKRMAIATNKVESLTNGLIRKLGLQPYFLLVVGPESVAHRKPNPEAIDLIILRLRMVPARTLVVGDTASDIQAGKAAGTFTCGVLYGYGREDDIKSARPDYTARSLDELPGFVS